MSPLFRLKVALRGLFGERVWSFVQQLSPLPRHRLIRLTRRQTGRVVQSGPFRGMQYVNDTVGGGYIPKLLGIYERELHGLVERLSRGPIQRVINIGAADGYYAIGLARANPACTVIAFEMEERGRALIRRMAETNDVADRIEIRGRCELPELREVLRTAGECIVLCDVEGFEDVLIDPDQVPELRSNSILVELHNQKNAGVSDRIKQRFVASHEIETIVQQARSAAEFPFRTRYVASLPPAIVAAAVDEGRPVQSLKEPMSWFWMVPKGV